MAVSARSRIMIGVTPMAMSAILEASPSPMTMKRIGSSASGGTIETAATKGASSARIVGSMPISMPMTSAMATAMPMPEKSRVRLAAVSAQSRICPERPSGTKAMRLMASTKDDSPGSSLSFALSASRAVEPAT